MLNQKTILLSVVIMVFGSVGGVVQAQNLTNQSIQDAIEDEFIFDPAVRAHPIEIEVHDSIVTLTGTTNNILAKERAARIAETVKGVRSVVNHIDVTPSKARPASEIRSDIETALLENAATSSYEIDVSVFDQGKVTLTGDVDSMQEKKLAGKVAKGVRGVIQLNNDLQIDFKEERSDFEIENEIRNLLKWDTLVDHALITVEVDNNEVSLSGVIGSAAEKREAIEDCWVAGVVEVDASDLEVKRWARDQDLRKGKYVHKDDEDIKQALKDAMMYDPRIQAQKVGVSVDEGIVTLRGIVKSLDTKRAAENVASHTVSVIEVVNRLKVKAEEDQSDETIQTNLEEALLRNPYVERFEITADVINGTAYLYGTVDSYWEKEEAGNIAAETTGVIDVQNNITVIDKDNPYVYNPYISPWNNYSTEWFEPSPSYTSRSDEEIKDDVKDELWWSPYVDSDDVKVTVEDGLVTLEGDVDSWMEFHSASENAWEGGATWVDNDLEVK
ncbi:BON domain-containing protein [bacterium]|nr:BON domain-containing protein [bacterium]